MMQACADHTLYLSEMKGMQADATTIEKQVCTKVCVAGLQK